MPTPISYHFQQRFNVSASKAFEWCTTYTPDDYVLMGEKGVSRNIEQITDRTILLTDGFNIGRDDAIEKQKLVQIYPDLLFWTSTHISGPARHSQFIYQITEESDRLSILDFTGLLVHYGDTIMSVSEIEKLAEETCKSDANTWELLARAMEDEQQ